MGITTIAILIFLVLFLCGLCIFIWEVWNDLFLTKRGAKEIMKEVLEEKEKKKKQGIKKD